MSTVIKRSRFLAQAFTLPSQGKATGARDSMNTLKNLVIPDTKFTYKTDDGVRLQEVAYQKGFEEGKRQGSADSDEEIRRLQRVMLAQAKEEVKEAEMARQRANEYEQEIAIEFKRLKELIEFFEQSKQAWFRASEDDLVASCFEVVGQVLGDVLSQEFALLEMVRHHVKSALAVGNVLVRLHPKDLEIIRRVPNRLLVVEASLCQQEIVGGNKLHQDSHDAVNTHVQWVGDASVVVGGCVVETDSGGVDVRLERTMERLREVLFAARTRGYAQQPREFEANMSMASKVHA